MKVWIKGETEPREMSVMSACVGIVVTKIEIGPKDIHFMRVLADRNPREFQAVMGQLQCRFESERRPVRDV